MSYEEINSILEEFINEENISEKIMTKKQAKRKKALRAKRRAEKLARQQAEQKKLLQQAVQKSEPDTIEAELVDDGEDNNNGNDNNKEDDKQPKEFKQLIVYNEKADTTAEPTDYSEAFKKVIQLYNELIKKYTERLKDADEKWQQAGKDKPCPPDVYNMAKQTIEEAQKEFESFLNNEIPQYADEMREEELAYIETQFTAINKFLEDYGKAIESLHPEEIAIPDNLKNDIEKETTDLTTTDKGNVDSLSSDKYKTQKHKSNQGKDLITYEKFRKMTHECKNVWKAITESEQELAKTSWGDFIKKLNPTDWFEDRLWSFINSAVVNDFVKTLMYSNPITAMLYDGKLINFGVKSGLQKIKAYRDKQRAAKDKAKEAKEKKQKDFYDERGLPKSLKDLTLKEMYNEYYGNPHFVELVNTAYNHPDTAADDSALIEDYTDSITQGFKDQNRASVYKNFSYLIKKLIEVADYQGWNDAKSFETARIEAGNDLNKKRKQNNLEIYKASKKKNTSNNDSIKTAIKYFIKTYKQTTKQNPKRQDIIDGLQADYKPNEIEAELDSINYQESYSITTRLQQLCENALA